MGAGAPPRRISAPRPCTGPAPAADRRNCRASPHPGRRISCPPCSGYRRNLQRQGTARRSEEHTSELQSLMRISYAVFCLKKKKKDKKTTPDHVNTTTDTITTNTKR